MTISPDHEVDISGHSILNNCLNSNSLLQWSHPVFLRLLSTAEKTNKKPPKLPTLQIPWKWQGLTAGVGAVGTHFLATFDLKSLIIEGEP